jgi:N-acetyl-gamma-glutamyl-phosphate reductase
MALNPSTALDGKFLDPEAVNGTNLVDLMCFESEQDLLLVARLDNLGKGAAGAAVQNLNIALNIEESVSLIQSEPSITAP